MAYPVLHVIERIVAPLGLRLPYGPVMLSVQVVVQQDSTSTWIAAAIGVVGALGGVLLANLLTRRTSLRVADEVRRLARQDEGLIELAEAVSPALADVEQRIAHLERWGDEARNLAWTAEHANGIVGTLLTLWVDRTRYKVSDASIRQIFDVRLHRLTDAPDPERGTGTADDLLRHLKALRDVLDEAHGGIDDIVRPRTP
jgi:hypothetical protein